MTATSHMYNGLSFEEKEKGEWVLARYSELFNESVA